jgi:hypothetical protein
MASIQDLLVQYQNSSIDLATKRATSATARQAATDADTAVAAAEKANADATAAVRDGLAKTGATFIVTSTGAPQVETDGTIQIFEPDSSTNGWRITIAKPSTLAIPE